MLTATILTIIATIAFLGTAMLFHEAGHFLIARFFRIRVTHFSLGVGPVLKKWTRQGTEYAVRAIPFAAYVKIVGMEPGEEHEPGGIYERPLAGRLCTIVAGAVMNFVLAFLLLTAIGIGWGIGKCVEVTGFSDVSPAREAGLLTGDWIIALDDVEVTDEMSLIEYVARRAYKPITVLVLRDGERLEFAFTTTSQKITPEEARRFALPEGVEERGLLGIAPGPAVYRNSARPDEYLMAGAIETYEVTRETLRFLGRLIVGRTRKGEQVIGPVGIVQTVSMFVALGLRPLLWLFAVLNISIGIFNLLPIPMFDGGRFVIMTIEGIRGKIFDKQKEAMVHLVGLILVIMFAIVVSVSDINRIAQGKNPLDEAVEGAHPAFESVDDAADKSDENASTQPSESPEVNAKAKSPQEMPEIDAGSQTEPGP